MTLDCEALKDETVKGHFFFIVRTDEGLSLFPCPFRTGFFFGKFTSHSLLSGGK